MTTEERELWEKLGLAHAIRAAERAAGDGLTDGERAILKTWRDMGLSHVGPEDARAYAREERARMDARQERAARLGVDWRYLPD
jgi:hypothetical protein